MNEFDELLTELATMTKAMTADVAQPPERDDDGNPKVDLPPARDPAGNAVDLPPARTDAEDDELLGKSFQVTMPDGTVQDAYDGFAMMKAMNVRVQGALGKAAALETELGAAKGELAKSLSVSAALMGLVKQQGELLKSLRTDLDALGNEGRGRRGAVIVPPDKTAGAGGGKAAPDGAAIMAKAMDLQAKGDLSAMDIARIEARLNAGMELPAGYASLLT